MTVEIFTTAPELGGQCNDSKQCKEVDQYSVCSRDNICKCNKGYTEISDYRLKGKDEYNNYTTKSYLFFKMFRIHCVRNDIVNITHVKEPTYTTDQT